MIPSAERNRSSIQIATLLSSPVFGAFVSGEAVGVGVTVAAVDAVVAEGAMVAEGAVIAEGAVVGVTEGVSVMEGSAVASSMVNSVAAEPLAESMLNVCVPTDRVDRNSGCRVIIVLPSALS